MPRVATKVERRRAKVESKIQPAPTAADRRAGFRVFFREHAEAAEEGVGRYRPTPPPRFLPHAAAKRPRNGGDDLKIRCN
jgi:hypothetical protein